MTDTDVSGDRLPSTGAAGWEGLGLTGNLEVSFIYLKPAIFFSSGKVSYSALVGEVSSPT